MISDDKQASLRAGWRIFSYFLMGFVIVASVNVVFIYKAVTTHTGEVTNSSYERGLAYNKTLDQAATEEKLGWTPSFSMEKAATGSYAVTLGVLDRSGKLIIFDSIQSMLRRPVNAASDVPVSFSMQKSGLYTSRVSLPFPGQWEVHAIMKSGKDQFHFVKRVIVQ